MYSLEVRVVIITGSSEGIGARLAAALRGARIEAGGGSK
jgi:NAD(P)-dependent dehydrogenase (short-subunit alcohol dehydrogenase family)